MDTNPDGVGLCNVGPAGQPEPWPEGFSVPYPGNLSKYEGEFQVIPYPNSFMYIRIPDLEYARGFRRTYLIVVLVKVIVDIANFLGKNPSLWRIWTLVKTGWTQAGSSTAWLPTFPTRR